MFGANVFDSQASCSDVAFPVDIGRHESVWMTIVTHEEELSYELVFQISLEQFSWIILPGVFSYAVANTLASNALKD
ncbi:hypothetical protein BGZ70_005071, partial [Mortierella alpina]